MEILIGFMLIVCILVVVISHLVVVMSHFIPQPYQRSKLNFKPGDYIPHDPQGAIRRLKQRGKL